MTRKMEVPIMIVRRVRRRALVKAFASVIPLFSDIASTVIDGFEFSEHGLKSL